jgi:uncharacterized membrane protein
MRLDGPAAGAAAARLPMIDVARGIAIVAMAVYHFSWDLRFFGYIEADVAGDLGWRLFARAIAGSFLLLVGVSLVLADRRGFDGKRFLRRLAVIIVAAAAITVVTRLVFPDAYIFFGILHAIAVMSVLGLPFLRAPLILVVAAAAFCFAAPALLSGPEFDHPALLWLGLLTHEPRTNDFVPLFPWFGVVLGGMTAARLALRFGMGALAAPMPALTRPLAWAGRHSLPIYLVHQPLLFGLVYLATQLAPPPPLGFAEWHLPTCTRQCVESGVAEASCRATCACLTERSEAEGLGPPLLTNSLAEEQLARYFDLAAQCREGSAAPAR